MKLTPAELAYVPAQGLYITEKCDGCGKLLNQSVRYTIKDRPDVYCSAVCRDRVFFGDAGEAKKRSTPKKCAHCGAKLNGKKRDALYCGDKCRMRANRSDRNSTTSKIANSDLTESSTYGREKS